MTRSVCKPTDEAPRPDAGQDHFRLPFLPQLGRHDEILRLPDGFFSRVAKHELRAAVPRANGVAQIKAEDGIRRVRCDRSQISLGLGGLAFCSLFLIQPLADPTQREPAGQGTDGSVEEDFNRVVGSVAGKVLDPAGWAELVRCGQDTDAQGKSPLDQPQSVREPHRSEALPVLPEHLDHLLR